MSSQTPKHGPAPIPPLALALQEAWVKYTEFFGQPPHGTEKQLVAWTYLLSDKTFASAPTLLKERDDLRAERIGLRAMRDRILTEKRSAEIEADTLREVNRELVDDMLAICKHWQSMTGSGDKYWQMCALVNDAQRKSQALKEGNADQWRHDAARANAREVAYEAHHPTANAKREGE